MRYDFIEIGTSDFDTLVEQDWPEDVHGICVEPMEIYLNNLIRRPNVVYVTTAISDKDGEATMYYPDPDFFQKHKEINRDIRGWNTLHTAHPSLKEHVTDSGLSSITTNEMCARLLPRKIKTIRVQTVTWETFATTHDITGIGHLKIDAEGHDIVILRQYFAYCEKHPECLADKIEFETMRNVWGDLIDEAIEHLNKLNYVELRVGRDNAMFVKEEPSYRQFGDFNLVVDN